MVDTFRNTNIDTFIIITETPIIPEQTIAQICEPIAYQAYQVNKTS